VNAIAAQASGTAAGVFPPPPEASHVKGFALIPDTASVAAAADITGADAEAGATAGEPATARTAWAEPGRTAGEADNPADAGADDAETGADPPEADASGADRITEAGRVDRAGPSATATVDTDSCNSGESAGETTDSLPERRLPAGAAGTAEWGRPRRDETADWPPPVASGACAPEAGLDTFDPPGDTDPTDTDPPEIDEPDPECPAGPACPPDRAALRVTPPEDPLSAEPADPDEPVVSANATPGAPATAAPTPRATASAPKRPTKSEADAPVLLSPDILVTPFVHGNATIKPRTVMR
jgi:hypothetical protein